MTTPDPADVHTGTDRVELTDAERRQLWQGWQTPSIGYTTTIRVVESIVAARVAALTDERDLFAHNCGQWMDSYRSQTEFAREVIAERDAARAELAELKGNQRRCEEGHGPLLRENKTLSAELAAANARCAELEGGSTFHSEACMDAHMLPCRCGADGRRARALQATLDRVTALADEWDTEHETGDPVCDACKIMDGLRAALTPEGKE